MNNYELSLHALSSSVAAARSAHTTVRAPFLPPHAILFRDVAEHTDAAHLYFDLFIDFPLRACFPFHVFFDSNVALW
jgi:hypothetical protein